MRAPRLLAAALLALLWERAAADVTVTCTQGCSQPDGLASVNLLFREDASREVTLTWEGEGDPGPVLLFAGKPRDVAERGPLAFAQEEGRWRARRTFSGAELGEGTFLTVLVSRPGEKERVLDWRAWRLATRAELERRRSVPAPGSELSLTLRPALLQARTGHGPLPPSHSEEPQPWWSFVDLEGNHGDLDLDGDASGIPGLGIQVSHPWHSRFGEDARAAVKARFDDAAREGLPEGRAFRLGELEWTESADRPVDVGPEKDRLVLRHYYSVVTLFTRASVATMDADEAGASHIFLDPTYFRHETSARLKHGKNPRFWASYSEREMGTNPRLLKLLASQVEKGRNVPGLGPVQMDDGDGGTATYTVGLWASVRPWTGEDVPAGQLQAGFVAVDVLAGRAGVGRPRSAGSSGNTFSEVPEPILCKVLRCGNEATKTIDLDRPPDGYRVWSPYVSMSTLRGALLTTEDPPVLASKDLDLPSATRFGLVAEMRAGALTENARWGHVRAFTPIDVWAQYVVRFTVAMKPAAVIVSGGAVIADPVKLNPIIATPEHGFMAWLSGIFGGAARAVLWGGIAAVVVAVLLFVPGARQVLNAVLKLVAALVERVTRKVKGQQGPQG